MESSEGDERLSRIVHLAVNDPEAASRFATEVVEGFANRFGGDPASWHFHLLALGHLGPDARPAIPMLCLAARRMLGEGKPSDCERLTRVIVSIDPEAKEAQVLLDALIARWSAPFTADPGLLEDAIIAFGPSARPKLGKIRRFESDRRLGFSSARLMLHLSPGPMTGSSAAPE